MSQYLNWNDVMRMYRLLGFNETNIAECRCIGLDDEGRVRRLINQSFFTNANDFYNWAKTYNGQGNCFVGRNPRDGVGSKGIRHISCITLDIDPIRPKDTAATQEQMEESFNAGMAILDKFKGGYLCGSGNGSLCIWTTDNPIVGDFKAFENKLKSFQDECGEIIKRFSGVKIDATQDSARLIKLIGTVSVKGGIRPTRFLYIRHRTGDGDDVFRHVINFDRKEPVTKEELLSRAFSDDRSRNDFILALHYKRRGLNARDCLEALAHHALGRPERHDDHVRIINKVYGEQETEDTTDKPSGIILHSPKTSLENYIDGLAKRGINEKPELPTGFQEFDSATYGLKRGEIYTVAARPGVGKSSYLLNVAGVLCNSGKRVLLLSTEMGYQDIWDRFLSIQTGIDGKKFTEGRFTDEERERKDKFMERFRTFDFHVCDAFSPNIDAVEKAVAVNTPDVLMFDHIQHIEGGEDYKELSIFTQKLKQLARSTNCAVMAASQITRPQKMMNFKTGSFILSKPTLSDLKGCGKIEEESAYVLLLYPSGSDHARDTPIITGDLAKNRYGPSVVCDLAFFKQVTTFKSLEDNHG